MTDKLSTDGDTELYEVLGIVLRTRYPGLPGRANEHVGICNPVYANGILAKLVEAVAIIQKHYGYSYSMDILSS
jgi:hypothetical protein